MCGQHNVRATAGDKKGQNTDKGHKLSSRIEIKKSDSVKNRTRTAGLEGRASTVHVTKTGSFFYLFISSSSTCTSIILLLFYFY